MTGGFKVIQPGFLSLYQDSGRHGWHRLGLTTGGPMDRQAHRWANRLCGNNAHCATLEVTLGGLLLEALIDTCIAFTGADMAVRVNGIVVDRWQSLCVKRGDRIELGMATAGMRGYLAVSGGFLGTPMFGSLASVPREHLGGHRQDGSALQRGDMLHCAALDKRSPCRALLPAGRPPSPAESLRLRVIRGYQASAFSGAQQRLFFSSDYQLTESSDRMGARLAGPAIGSVASALLSEGICLGAVQIPADGQPIILLRDRQTIGGYPKIGAVLSLDLDGLAQLPPGGTVSFESISIEQAHAAVLLAERKFLATELSEV